MSCHPNRLNRTNHHTNSYTSIRERVLWGGASLLSLCGRLPSNQHAAIPHTTHASRIAQLYACTRRLSTTTYISKVMQLQTAIQMQNTTRNRAANKLATKRSSLAHRTPHAGSHSATSCPYYTIIHEPYKHAVRTLTRCETTTQNTTPTQ